MYSDLDRHQFLQLEPVVQDLIERGTRISAVEFGKANLVREVIWRELCSIFDRYDLLICPTTATSAFPIDAGPPSHIKGMPINNLLGWFLTYPFNMTGNPAASIPCGVDADGLPIGLQIIGRRFDDALVLRACRSFEIAQPWGRPSIA
jgi:aspartyl-tRNA(Asn)/glutamyl-tRNA(Gln) amidotransferase subunit A